MQMYDSSARTHQKIYVNLVESLFTDIKSMSVGITAHILCSMLVYWHTRDIVFLYLSAGIFIAGIVRICGVKYFAMQSWDGSRKQAVMRETYYIALACFHSAFLGAFTYYSIVYSNNQFAEVAAVTVALGTAIGVPVRNFGSPRLVAALVFFIAAPVAFGFLMRGEAHWFYLGLFCVPFVWTMLSFSKKLRNDFREVAIERQRSTSLAKRFDDALNTMGECLIMVRPDQRITVSNRLAAKMLGFARPRDVQGKMFGDVIKGMIGRKFITAQEAQKVDYLVSKTTGDGCARTIIIQTLFNRFFELTARKGNGGLCVVTFQDVTVRVNAHEQIKYMASYDALTGLANRNSILEQVSQNRDERDENQPFALVLIDISGFKTINEALGHSVGDSVLRAFGARLKILCDDALIQARTGSDEFALFFPNVDDESAFRANINALVAQLERPILVDDHELDIKVCLGVLIEAGNNCPVDDLINRTNFALSQAKIPTEPSVQFYEGQIEKQFNDRQILRSELFGAIERDELSMLYQPLMDSKKMRLVGCEALCRWTHPKLGLISPGVFIPLAEEMGIITSITCFAIDRAIRDCAEMVGDMRVSVNLSAYDFETPKIIDVVRDALERHQLAPHRLELEVTESVFVGDRAQVHSYLNELKDLGVAIALDDFGTGYSNLGYINSLPLDKVKVDRAFLKGMESDPMSLKLLKGIVSLSQRLGLSVTIEGVETDNQFNLISKSVRPDFIQGFLFGPPLPKSAIAAIASAVNPIQSCLDAGEAMCQA